MCSFYCVVGIPVKSKTSAFNKPSFTCRSNAFVNYYAAGGTLTLDTCVGNGAMNTVLSIGTQCPASITFASTAVNWGCLAYNDAATVNAQCASARVTASASWLSITATQNKYFVIVSLPTTTTIAPGAYGLRWNYIQPSPSITPTSSITASNTPTASFSTGASQSPTTSITSSASSSPSMGYTATPTQTAQCLLPNVAARLTGLNNTVLVTIDPAASTMVGTAGTTTCTGYTINTQPKNVLTVDFGPTFVPGGSVRVTSCYTGTTLDTVRGCCCPFANRCHVVAV